MDKFKLNYKRTVFVGLAFFLITLFWTAYDAIIPKILIDKFGMSHFWSGVIMAFDNVIALFLLPLFGSISDKAKFKKGRRTPFIIVGTIIAAAALVSLSFVDAAQLKRLEPVVAVTDSDSAGYAEAMGELYDADLEISVGNEKIKLSDKFERDEFVNYVEQYRGTVTGDVDTQSKEYMAFVSDYVTPARQAYAAKTVSSAPSAMILFIVILLLTLIAMATFRSPAVALMPDVTPKPLRSKANAIINLMGVVGAVIILASGILFGTGNPQNSLMSYVVYFAMVAVLMVLALVVFLFTVNEPKLVKKMKQESEEMGIADEADDGSDKSDKKAHGKLSRGEFRSLIFILLSVIFWFMGYNAVTSKYSVYAGAVLQLDYNTTLILAQAAALIAFIPVGILATKIGRKKSILIGVAFLTSAVFVGSFFDAGVNIWFVNVVFVFAGLGWAMINVNSYPMVVELASRGNVGKYTGFYYTASMSAQTLTPILSGFFLDEYGIKTLFPYAAICVGISFVTMLFVKHGDSKPLAKKPSLEALDVD